MKTTKNWVIPGNIVESRHGKHIILSSPQMGRVWNTYAVIHVSDVEKALKDPTTVPVATWKVREGFSFNIVGSITTATLTKIQKAYSTKRSVVVKHNAEVKDKKYKQNSPSINWNQNGYAVTMQDGKEAKVGDVVVVQFTNGRFNGTIKQIAGKDDGTISIVFRGRTKGRSIAPKNILRKAE